jgi:hypothetical protein
MKKIIDKLFSVFIFALVIFVPFQSITQAFLNKYLSSSVAFWLGHWYEPVVIVLFLISIALSLRGKNCRSNLSNCRAPLAMTDWIALALMILGIISIVFISPSIGRGLEGFRFTLFAVMILTIVRHYHISNKLVMYYLVVAGLIAAWALVERVLPLGYWTNILGSSFGWGNFSIVKYYQSSSVLAGPNQLASYLIPALFIVINRAGKISNIKYQISKIWNLFYIIYCLILSAAVFFSFSRSAWVAVAITLVITWIITLVKRDRYTKAVKWTLGAISVAILTVSVCLISAPLISDSDIFTHGQSQSQHIYAIKDSLSEIGDRISHPVKLFFGSGLGTAGPAVLKYGDGFVSESWYLQLALELGIFGLGLWLALIVTLVVRLWREHQEGLMLGLIGVSIAAIFLHTWADNPALAITLFVLIGMATANKENTTTDLIH